MEEDTAEDTAPKAPKESVWMDDAGRTRKRKTSTQGAGSPGVATGKTKTYRSWTPCAPPRSRPPPRAPRPPPHAALPISHTA